MKNISTLHKLKASIIKKHRVYYIGHICIFQLHVLPYIDYCSYNWLYIEITSWKVRAYGFYSRVVKYHKTNEQVFERVSFMIRNNE
jgi:hypothetical protein